MVDKSHQTQQQDSEEEKQEKHLAVASHKATQLINKTITIALERSVVKPNWGLNLLYWYQISTVGSNVVKSIK